jgi:aspartate beta-hydroxylase
MATAGACRLSTAWEQALLGEARAAQAAGDLTKAERTYQALLARNPANADALNSLGVIAIRRGDIATAISRHRAATVADPAAPVLWLNLAKAQRMAGDDAAERASLDAALAIDAVMFPALVRKAELHERLGETGEAARLWQGVLAIAPASQGGELDTILDHARRFVAAQTAQFAALIDAGLVNARADAQGSLRRFDACVGFATGRRQVYVNECAGTYFPFLPADEFFERDHFPWMAALEAQTDAIRAELNALLTDGAPGFAPYVQMTSGTPDNKWTPLDGSAAWDAYHLWQYGKPVADAHLRCPATVAALAAVPQLHLPGRCPSAFFSVLRPGARIPAHTGVTNVRAIIHLPLIVPDGCGFRVGGETRAWRTGEAFAFDDTIEHEAWNTSDTLRAVLILDVWNPHLTETERTMLSHYFEAADAGGWKAESGAGY